MASVNMLVFVFFAICGLFHNTFGEVVQGVAPLNAGLFDKLVPKFKATLVKFDESYPYGDKHNVFKNVAKATISQTDLLVGEVNIADYGEKDNYDLAERFGVKKEDYPVYKLFLQGQDDPVDYKGDVTDEDAIKRFILKETGLWLGLPACIEEFDILTRDFLSASSDNRKNILETVEKKAADITEETKKFSATVYVKTMQKIVEKGDSFVNAELDRVVKLSEGKVSDKKKAQLKDRASILSSIQMHLTDRSAKQEL